MEQIKTSKTGRNRKRLEQMETSFKKQVRKRTWEGCRGWEVVWRQWWGGQRRPSWTNAKTALTTRLPYCQLFTVYCSLFFVVFLWLHIAGLKTSNLDQGKKALTTRLSYCLSCFLCRFYQAFILSAILCFQFSYHLTLLQSFTRLSYIAGYSFFSQTSSKLLSGFTRFSYYWLFFASFSYDFTVKLRG